MKKYALCIGIEHYRDPRIAPLRYAAADARVLGGRLRDQCGFDKVVVLTDREGDRSPDLVNIADTLQNLAGEIRSDDLFLLFFSGHGVQVDGRGYLFTRDSTQAFPKLGSLPIDTLRETLARLEASHRVLLIDACRNTPQAGKGDVGNPMEEALSKDIVTALRVPAGRSATTALLSACQPGQRAYEWPAQQHGVFTHYLLEGLSGAAWRGLRLEFRDLAAYTSQAVRRWCDRTPGIAQPQEPWYEEVGTPQPILLGEHKGAETIAAARPAPVRETLVPPQPVLATPPPTYSANPPPRSAPPPYPFSPPLAGPRQVPPVISPPDRLDQFARGCRTVVRVVLLVLSACFMVGLLLTVGLSMLGVLFHAPMMIRGPMRMFEPHFWFGLPPFSTLFLVFIVILVLRRFNRRR